MRQRRVRHPRPVRAGLLAVALAALVVALAATRGSIVLPDGTSQVVRAQFAATNQLRKGHTVRVAGVKVGTVKRIALAEGGRRTNVELAITDDRLVVHDDATATLRWTTLLGGRLYVDLDPGRAGRPELRAAIPPSRTSSQVEFDDLTSTLRGSGLQDTQTVIRGTRQAYGATASIQRLLRVFPGSMRTLRSGLPPLLGTEAGDLRRLVAATAKTTSALSADPGALQELVGEAARTTRALAVHRDALGASVAQLPASLDDTRETTRRLDATLAVLRPLAGRLRPGARALAPTLRTLRPVLGRADRVLGEADPLLRRLEPALGSLHETATVGGPLVDALKPTVDRLNDELLPFLDSRESETKRRTVEMIGPGIASVAQASTEFDRSGNVLHFGVLADERSLLNLPCQMFFTDPSAEDKIRCTDAKQRLRGLFRSLSTATPSKGAGR